MSRRSTGSGGAPISSAKQIGSRRAEAALDVGRLIRRYPEAVDVVAHEHHLQELAVQGHREVLVDGELGSVQQGAASGHLGRERLKRSRADAWHAG